MAGAQAARRLARTQTSGASSAGADSRPPGPAWHSYGAPSTVLEQGSELPLAVAALLGALLVAHARRRPAAPPAIRWASWIAPLAAPPPRMT